MIFLRGLLYATAVVFCFLFFYCLAHRRNQLSPLFSLMSLAIIVYAAGYAFELGSKNVEEIKFWLKFEYFGLPFIPSFWLLFAYKFQFKREPPFHGFVIVLLIPILTIFLSATNDYHHLYYRSVSVIVANGQLYAQLDKGPWYWVFVIYSNTMIALSLVSFFKQWKSSKLGIASRSFWMMLGAAWVGLLELLYLVGLAPHNIDLTAFGFLGAALFDAVAIVRYDFLKSDELVKDIVFSGINEGILILDDEERISDYNAAGGRVFPWLNSDSIGKKLSDLPEGAALEQAVSRRKVLRLTRDGKGRYFEVKMTQLLDKKKVVGKVFMFQDVTALHRVLRKLYRLANYDTLTKIFNRRRFFDDAEKEVSRIARYGGQISLLMIDLDLFKDVNDLYGHQAGDTVLAEVAQTLKRRIRASDILGRYGGEEFVIILVAMDPGKAFQIAESIREGVEDLRISHAGKVMKITVSIGVATSAQDAQGISLEKLLLEADLALYRAKREGRNKVCAGAAKERS